ncbi:Hypothetical protein PSEBR_m1727 [Pseudomonas brassicacearum subsp. brassicacearum NFM421]|uniref:Uncharacterized protein n=1 Tax=Pseudomonas brassicacearum (strain NFM421) TaxID=994484 RepID=F2K6Z1_PSEBN|nr:Hypothetical protein PSEBR_m1727 [Pseudomonas brassicacearum subsp. brassicacearum NFM421]
MCTPSTSAGADLNYQPLQQGLAVPGKRFGVQGIGSKAICGARASVGAKLARDTGTSVPANTALTSSRASLAPTDNSTFLNKSLATQTLDSVTPHPQSDNVRLSIAAGMLGSQLHGRSP